MPDHKFDDFSRYFYNWQKNIINFTLKRNLANKELENYIRSFRNIDSEIVKALFAAKEFYDKRRRYYKRKIKDLKRKDIEFKRVLEYAYEEKKKVNKPKIKDELTSSIHHIKSSLEEIELKIYDLNNEIEEQNLDLDEESYIVEEIQNLDRDKQINLRHLKKLEGDLNNEIQNNIYFKTMRTIEILEVNLKTINTKLNKWSKRKVKTHKQMLNLYRKAKAFENIKKQIESELFGAKQTNEKNLELFYKLKDKSQKQAFQEQMNIYRKKKKEEEVKKLKTKYIVERKRTQKKYTKEKLAIALEKQKLGKKLDFYELKLILEHSKQKK
ncbi:MAG: hypothetical protein EAX91_00460 [Candidatus Lokiarchaeota archaeon]|nr:hypothetical protein [Candidatus Lokiarchaeota archaeon]